MNGNIIKGKKILIVDDDYSSKLYLNKVLEMQEAVILNAGDGKEVMDKVRLNPDISVILMDIKLPIIDGYTCTKMLRESGNKMIIIAQTAFGLTGDREKMISLGFTDCLVKPIGQKQLVEKISHYLSNH